jgi:hypothetical protein
VFAGVNGSGLRALFACTFVLHEPGLLASRANLASTKLAQASLAGERIRRGTL